MAEPQPLPAKKRGCLKKSLLGILALVLVLVVLEVVGWRKLSAAHEEWTKDTAAERTKLAAARSPVLRGTALEENAGPRYQKLLEEVKDADTLAIASVLSGGAPGKPLPEKAVAILEKHRTTIAALREAVRCDRCDWGLELEKGPAMPFPGLLPARTLANLVLLEGWECAGKGDMEGAAQHFLDVVRFGSDWNGPLIMVMIGYAIEQNGLHALGKLAVASESGFPAATARAELAKLAPGVSDLGPLQGAMRMERLAFVKAATDADPDTLSGPAPVTLLVKVARHAFFGLQIGGYLDAIKDTETVMAIDDPAERTRVGAEKGERVGASWNILVRLGVPGLAAARDAHDRVVALLRITDGACSAESRRSADGKYPAELADVGDDPWAPGAKLAYTVTPDGTGYTIATKGDGTASSSKELRLERKPR